MSDIEQDICPNCKVDLSEEYIWDHFFKKKGCENEATRIAEMYGASKGKGKFSRKIGIYNLEEDRTFAWQCPDCNHRWERIRQVSNRKFDI